MIGRLQAQQVSLVVILALALAAGPGRASDGGKEPAPEPYSFSYNAESKGGFSSHQESGDGSGRVQGFYIIMGEDNRERRVDYVADENGYRASISTNEVGTRSESSADAQYNARLPSKEQLDQAKVTAEEYKFLEDQHAAERERHLSKVGQQAQQVQEQQQQQQQQQVPQNSQRWMGANRQSSQPSLPEPQRWAPAQPAPGQPLLSNQVGNTTTSESYDDEGWRKSARLQQAYSQPPNQQQYADQQPEQKTNTFSAIQSAPGQIQNLSPVSKTSPQQAKFEVTANQARGQAAVATNAPFATVAGIASGLKEATSLDQTQVPQQLVSAQLEPQISQPVRGAEAPALQAQFMQQFMQQANQLTAQDYPRQTSQPNFGSTFQQQNVNFASKQQQQQPLQPQRILSDEPVSLTQSVVASQMPQWQDTVGSANQRATSDFSQANQQQSNIIDEVAGEQTDSQQATSEAAREVVQTFTTAAPVEAVKTEPIKTTQLVLPQQQVQQQQTFQSYETTTGRPAPSGFLAINLNQETDTKSPGDGYQQLEVGGQQVEQTGQQQQQQEQQPQQQKEVYQQQRRPVSIQQIIQEGDREQQNVEQEAPRPTVPSTVAPVTQSYTVRQELEAVTTFRPTVLMTRAPVYTTAPVTYPTTSTTAARKVVEVQQQEQIQQQAIASTTTVPERVTPASLEVLIQTTRRPVTVNQQQVVGVKGGVQGVKRVVAGPRYTTPTSTSPVRPVDRKVPSAPTPTTRQPYSTTTLLAQKPEPARVTTTSETPILPDRQTKQQQPQQQQQQQQQQVEIPKAPERRPETSTGYTGQKQAAKGGEYFTSTRPTRIDTVAPLQPVYQQQTQQQWKGGVKGSNRPAGRKQFWQQQQQQQQQYSSEGQKAPAQVVDQLAMSSAVQSRKFQASVDYTASADFGSRIQGRG